MRLETKVEHRQVLEAIADRDLGSTEAIAIRTGIPEFRVRQIIDCLIKFGKLDREEIKKIKGAEEE